MGSIAHYVLKDAENFRHFPLVLYTMPTALCVLSRFFSDFFPSLSLQIISRFNDLSKGNVLCGRRVCMWVLKSRSSFRLELHAKQIEK